MTVLLARIGRTPKYNVCSPKNFIYQLLNGHEERKESHEAEGEASISKTPPQHCSCCYFALE
ncbi:hypothetical protein DPMN_111607 [Dreissena polymorpha]|uniref:Uncharacterized protein n=1 Tax=Dreissena polymorpha TaxID=45954 RepID=A0A9D4QP60_DREPO|nr:hypothetical protein DPMN_111607 [Dreissena polymorpha]